MQLYEVSIASTFLPEYINLAMVKWLKFSYFVLGWLFSPKELQLQLGNSQGCE